MKQLPMPDTVTFYQLSYFSLGKYGVMPNPEMNSVGLFHTEQAAQNQKLMELMKNPSGRYFVHALEFSTKDLV